MTVGKLKKVEKELTQAIETRKILEQEWEKKTKAIRDLEVNCMHIYSIMCRCCVHAVAVCIYNNSL